MKLTNPFANKKGIAESRVLRELDISHSVISNWKNGSIPSNRTMRQIADYFVARDYEAPEPTAQVVYKPSPTRPPRRNPQNLMRNYPPSIITPKRITKTSAPAMSTKTLRETMI